MTLCPNSDLQLYIELLEYCGEVRERQKHKFPGTLELSDINIRCYNIMYVENESSARPQTFKQNGLPELSVLCRECAKFFLNKRTEFDKGLDIQLGSWMENTFQEFLSSKDITTAKKGYPFPDYAVIDEEEKTYYELKYIRAPFINANNECGSERWCYECSLTLDVGDKLLAQRKKIEADLLSNEKQVYYVWWYDVPCIKGIFYMGAEEIFEYWDNVGTSHTRETREGDKVTKQELNKIYPPLLYMKGFADFINALK